LQKATNGAGYLVIAKQGLPHKAIGWIQFTSGKLKTAIRYWAPENQQEGVEFAHSVIGAISQLFEDGNRTCTISAGTKNSPVGSDKAAWIVCGNKGINISVVHYSGQPEAADVAEWLGVPTQAP